METIRFLHTADLHLDSPFKGMSASGPDEIEKIQQSTFQAFDRMITYAVEQQPDFIVIVGDIYDGEDRSLRAQIRFQQGMKRLDQAQIPVFLSYGNHDHLAGKWTRVSLPENVHVFAETVEQKRLTVRGETVTLHGFSYPQRHVREPMIADYQQADEGIHIGMLHGSVAGDSAHAVYAPFTISDLQRKNYQYWALGHIHKRQVLAQNPPIVYPGNLQGRHKNEQGVKGFYDVSLSGNQSSMTFVPASAIVFTTLTISCEGIEYADDWVAVCQKAIDYVAAEIGNIIIELVMTDTESLATALQRTSSESEWLEILREQYILQEPFVWIRAIEWPTLSANDFSTSLVDPVVDTMKNWQADEWDDVLAELYSHRVGRYIEPLTTSGREQLHQQASALLASELLKES
ncbi:DNA repair exonuclease [Sporosarcina sp. PTS2304]|uniref:metallophosphoesterase family protein n=1 Tax=Sporosarcina sp. PTS2304 TaxID=2283194 RepID=UPI000E0D05BC|nr:DNA repair exonuclease [Sporosarcina sp. PTS2304]AXH99896.1 DNA repair exonuclease [Sporosarcina sp. PTS2304]